LSCENNFPRASRSACKTRDAARTNRAAAAAAAKSSSYGIIPI
jgi:hypothetical protein